MHEDHPQHENMGSPVRNKPCTKRGRIILACTAKTSPTGKALQVGEATLVGCKVVAQYRHGFLAPHPDKVADFMFLKKNLKKHQIFSIDDFPVLKTYKTVYAWVLQDAVAYPTPLELHAKRGCVVWVKV